MATRERNIHRRPAAGDEALVDEVRARKAEPGISFDELYARLKTEQPTKVDAVVRTDHHVGLELVPRPDAEGRDVNLMFFTPEVPELDGRLAGMTDYMHGQVAARTGIDKKYYDRMRLAQPELLIKNIETWWQAEPDKRMARLAQPARVDAGRIQVGNLMGRAWLSDRYRALDNLDFVMTVLETADDHGAKIHTCHLDDERVYIKLVSDRLQASIGRVPGTNVDDVIQAGCIVKNSEVGDGRVLVQPYILRLWCLNGAVREEQFGQVHLGGEKEVGILQQDTLEAEARSVWMQVRDWVAATFQGVFLERSVEEFRRAQGEPVKVEARRAVANVVRNGSLTGQDGQGILEKFLRGNDDSMFGLVNAVTQYAHEGAVDYRKQVDLEAYGGKLLSTDPKAFRHIVNMPLEEQQVLKAVNAN